MKFFLFKTKTELWIVKDPSKVPKPRELLLQNSQIEIIRDKAKILGKGLTIVDKVTIKKTARHSPETRKKISEAMTGEKNPCWGGLTSEHKAKISRTMRGTRRRDANPMYARRHTWETRRLMAIKASMRRRKWCVEPNGKCHLVDPLTFTLPGGWLWGMKYDPYRPRD
jgi:hypothetical protein